MKVNQIGNSVEIEQVGNVLDSIRTEYKFKETAGPLCKRHISVIGTSGVGKTQAFLKYQEFYPGYRDVSAGGITEIKPVVYVDLLTPFTFKQLYFQIIYALGLEFPNWIGRVSTHDIRRRALYVLQEMKVELLILDELDSILTSRVNQKATLRELYNFAFDANITLVLAGTSKVENLIDLLPLNKKIIVSEREC